VRFRVSGFGFGAVGVRVQRFAFQDLDFESLVFGAIGSGRLAAGSLITDLNLLRGFAVIA